MKISHVRELLKDKRVIEEINRHLWIESQKAGYSIGIERATDEWLRLYAQGWMKYHMPEKFAALKVKAKKDQEKKRRVARSKNASEKKVKKKTVKKPVKKKTAKKSTRTHKTKKNRKAKK